MKVILLLLLATFNTFAIENDFGMWLGTFAKKKVTRKYSIWMETQFRYNFDLGKTSQLLYRTGVLKKANKNSEWGFLYGNIQSRALSEHRPTLQHIYNFGEVKDFALSARARLELRMFEDLSNDHLRGRYLFRMDLKRNSLKDIVIWDELFVNITENKNREDDIIDRNRFFLGKRLYKHDLILEVGYMNQYIPLSGDDVSEHLLVAYIFI